MAETILLDKDIETKVKAGYNVFEKYLESLEATLRCQQKARWAQSVKRNPRANGASRKINVNPTTASPKKGHENRNRKQPQTGLEELLKGHKRPIAKTVGTKRYY